ncbi:histidine--tRNA ligase [Candidatus Mesenet endosymbiont of Agriotes lineatus]|uniref:histidine--tRNA ligase n=1 Tax=Candidatus Mesenet endosymbiont of Agriotes lineatus TaxID=3077948 RepID=UPI0030D4CF65
MKNNKLQEIRGTKDLLPDEYFKLKYVQEVAESISRLYGFLPIDTPILEFTEVFTKALGETSDVIMKEMYTFDDKGGESITLRPEFTAAIARLFIGKRLQPPIKLFSTGPIFRYERPQKCRQRQFHQINFESFGNREPQADTEIIALGYHILSKLGLNDKIRLEINSLGDDETIKAYRSALVEYLTKYKDSLSEVSRKRLEINPLRILDSKDDKDKELLLHVPKINNFYTECSRKFFDEVLSGLENLGIPYLINTKLVRGLDYYCHTVFEFATEDLGAQGAVLAGGRYDGLIAAMGGSKTSAIGFAGGIERIIELIDYKHKYIRPITLIPIGNDAEKYAISLAFKLRQNRYYIIWGYSGTTRQRMGYANKINACVSLIFGDEELSDKKIKLKNMDTQEEQKVDLNNIEQALAQFKCKVTEER